MALSVGAGRALSQLPPLCSGGPLVLLVRAAGTGRWDPQQQAPELWARTLRPLWPCPPGSGLRVAPEDPALARAATVL